MNTLAAKYGDKLAILGFFCNQFGHQSNGTEAENMNILKHVRPGNGFQVATQVELFAKIDVNGKNADPLFKWLKECQRVPFGPAGDRKGIGVEDNNTITRDDKFVLWAPIAHNDIAWNFEKFLVSPHGHLVQRYSRYVVIDDIIPDIDPLVKGALSA